MGNRYIALSVVLYVAGSVSDNLMTWWFVVHTGKFVELNPFMRGFIASYPLWVWFLRDLAGFAAIVFASLAFRWFVLRSSVREPPDVRVKLESIAGKYWVIPLTAASFRLLPAIHDALTVAGYETPLPDILLRWVISLSP